MNEMLNITRTELLLLLILSITGGQVFALAYSHHLWSIGACLTLVCASAVILAIVFGVYKRSGSGSRQPDGKQAPQKS